VVGRYTENKMSQKQMMFQMVGFLTVLHTKMPFAPPFGIHYLTASASVNP